MRWVSRPGLLLGLAYLGYVGLAVRGGVLGIAWPSIRTDFDVSLDALGALRGPGSVSYLVGSFVSGQALARWDLGLLLAAGFGGLAFNLAGTAIATSWWMRPCRSGVTWPGHGRTAAKRLHSTRRSYP